MSSSNQGQYSPFFKVKKIFTVFHLLGLPFKLDIEGIDHFKFNPWTALLKFILYNAFFIILGFGYSGFLVMKSTDTKNLIDAYMMKMGIFGQSGLDMGVMIGYPLVSLISASFYFVMLINKKDQLNKICRLLTDTNKELSREWKGMNFGSSIPYKSIYVKMILIAIIAIMSGVTLASSYIASFFYTPSEKLSRTEKILFCVSNLTINPLLVYPPISFATDLIITQLLFEVSISFTKLKDILKYKCLSNHLDKNAKETGSDLDQAAVEKRESLRKNMNINVVELRSSFGTTIDGKEVMNIDSQKYDTDRICSTGVRLMKVIKKIDSTFACMLVNTYFVCILSTTANLYTSLSILFKRDHMELWLMSGANFCISVLTIQRLIWLTIYSHKLTASMKKCGHHLDRFVAIKDETCTKALQLLKQDLRYYSETPINPFSAFSVSTSTFVGACGTIITYLIVLLQFKVAE